MRIMRLLHFADLHLDAPFAWARPETARLRRRNRRETLTRILQLADDEGVDAILCAGDLFEHERFTPDTVAFLRESFARTDRPIYVAPGNHDWYSARSPYALEEWSPNVHVFTDARLTPVELADGLTLWGAAHRAPANTGHKCAITLQRSSSASAHPHFGQARWRPPEPHRGGNIPN